MEFFGYLACFQLITEGARINMGEDTIQSFGFMIAFTGLCFIFPMFLYGTKLHLRKSRAKKDVAKFVTIIMLWLALCYIPLAMEF